MQVSLLITVKWFECYRSCFDGVVRRWKLFSCHKLDSSFTASIYFDWLQTGGRASINTSFQVSQSSLLRPFKQKIWGNDYQFHARTKTLTEVFSSLSLCLLIPQCSIYKTWFGLWFYQQNGYKLLFWPLTNRLQNILIIDFHVNQSSVILRLKLTLKSFWRSAVADASFMLVSGSPPSARLSNKNLFCWRSVSKCWKR